MTAASLPSPTPSRLDAGRITTMAFAVVALLVSGRMIVSSLPPSPYLPDFAVFWTAARLALVDQALVYDVAAITQAQSWLVDPAVGPRPFAYPPSALLLFLPFAALPAGPALLLWGAVSLGAFAAAAKQFVRGGTWTLALISPAVAWCLLSGQTALLLGAAILGGVATLSRRPIVAGILLGLVAAVKPQALLLAPLALARAGEWRALAAAVAAGTATVLASLALGPQLWIDWLGSLGEFRAIVETGNLHPLGITPNSVAAVIGLAPPWRVAVQAGGIALGCATVWWAFGSGDLRLRAAALIGGSLLCSPYAMPYELAMLAPVAAATLVAGRRWSPLAGFTLIGLTGVVPVLALLAALFLEQREAAGKIMVNRPFSAG